MSQISFFLPGACSDRYYADVRDGQRSPLIEGRAFTESLWQRYQGFADPHFREDARAHFIERFWEMYLAVAFLDRGLEVSPGSGRGPEFYFMSGKTRVWVEAVAPGPGAGIDRVPEIELGVGCEVPTEKLLLRFANALAEKRARYESALAAAIISAEDGYVLAINSRRIPHAPYYYTLPYFVQALLPIGDLTLMFNRDLGNVEDAFYKTRETVAKANRAPVSMRPFLDPEFAFVSAVLHSVVECVSRPQEIGGDFAVLHNPGALHPIHPSVFDWCDQYFYREDVLEKRMAKTGM
jgi:type I restriction enzyme S subunit